MSRKARIERLGPLPGGAPGEVLGVARLGGEADQPVVLRPVPRELWHEPGRRAQLQRELRRAADLMHPNVAQPLGLDEAEDAATRIEAWAEVEPLSEVLATGGRMPPTIAARVVADACAGVHFAHQEDGDGSMVHGHLRPEALLVSRSGVTRVAGFGSGVVEGARPLRERLPWVSPEQLLGGPGAADRQSDVYLLGLVLHACLAGEAPLAGEADVEKAVLEGRPAPLEPLGVPRALAEVVEKATARMASHRHASAAELALDVERAAGDLAPPGAVAAWLDVLLPASEGVRAARRTLLGTALAGRSEAAIPAAGPAPKPPEPVADEHIVGAPTPVPVPPLRPPPVDVMRTADIVLDASSPRVGPDLVTTREIVGEGSAPFMVARPPAPPAEAPRRSPATAVLAAGIAVAGLAIGYGLSRRGQVPAPSPVPAVASVPTPAEPPAPAARAPAPRVQPRREREPAGPPSIEVTADPAGDVYVDGKRAGRTPLTRAVSRGRHKVRLVDRASGVDVTKVVEVKAARAPVRFALGKGTLTVTAPEGAVIFLDGRKVGAGGVQDLPVYEGTHNLTVQLGQARNDHAFRIGPAETYRYDVERTGP